MCWGFEAGARSFEAKSTPPQPSPSLREREGARAAPRPSDRLPRTASSLSRREGEGWGGVAFQLSTQCQLRGLCRSYGIVGKAPAEHGSALQAPLPFTGEGLGGGQPFGQCGKAPAEHGSALQGAGGGLRFGCFFIHRKRRNRLHHAVLLLLRFARQRWQFNHRFVDVGIG